MSPTLSDPGKLTTAQFCAIIAAVVERALLPIRFRLTHQHRAPTRE